MDQQDHAQLRLELLLLALKYGFPAILAVVAAWSKTELSEADLEALEKGVRTPESYFVKGESSSVPQAPQNDPQGSEKE